ncbi:MAG TPA: oxygen-independent coproporphyrinogen III oxidase [Usitatibacter sp.]|nr:oxygen-independent coproporphyrinogen III oxidase [Usitatibacter sp.]
MAKTDNLTQFTDEALVVDTGLLRKYGGAGPRYTSYPTADRFVETFDGEAHRHWLGHRSVGGFTRPLGLYVHVPFCDTLCFYCACNKIATRDHERAVRYVNYLQKEIALVAGALAPNDRRIVKMHWGGGTPTFLGDDESARLVRSLREHFDFDPAGEYAIEIDPRKVDAGRIRHLATLGFNRMSVGVQDFNIEVQRAVNRVQSLEQTREVIDAARANGFRSVNMDLIFGLPKQTVPGFAETLERVIECDPDRIALYAYAHLPKAFYPQRRIQEADLPAPEVKLELMTGAIRRLREAGYVYIGMDHFAKPTDDLAVAQRRGRLTRDFQGYSAGGDTDLAALGTSAISKIGPTYAQNVKTLDAYYKALDDGCMPTLRGIQLTPDDLVRRAVIQALACHFQLAKESIEIAHLIEFDRYFAWELEALKKLEADGLVELDDEWIHVTPRGRLLVRCVCMVFDKYLRAAEQRAQYSRVM